VRTTHTVPGKAVRGISRALVVAAVMVLAVVGLSAPASAATVNGTFESGEIMFWGNANFNIGGGTYEDVSTNLVTFVGEIYNLNGSGSLNNTISSSANGFSEVIFTFLDANCEGDFVTHLPHLQVVGGLSYAYSSLGSFDNKLTSYGNDDHDCVL